MQRPDAGSFAAECQSEDGHRSHWEDGNWERTLSKAHRSTGGRHWVLKTTWVFHVFVLFFMPQCRISFFVLQVLCPKIGSIIQRRHSSLFIKKRRGEDSTLEKDITVGVMPGTRGKRRRWKRWIQDKKPLQVNIHAAAKMTRERQMIMEGERPSCRLPPIHHQWLASDVCRGHTMRFSTF